MHQIRSTPRRIAGPRWSDHPASDYEENIAAYRARISIASWNCEAFANWMGREGHGERDCSNVFFEIRGRLSHRWMEVNHRTTVRIRFLPEMRTEAQHAGGLHWTEERQRKRGRKRAIPMTAGRPLKKVMRIYSDGRESRTCTEERRGEPTRESCPSGFCKWRVCCRSWRKATRHSSTEGWHTQSLAGKKIHPRWNPFS